MKLVSWKQNRRIQAEKCNNKKKQCERAEFTQKRWLQIEVHIALTFNYIVLTFNWKSQLSGKLYIVLRNLPKSEKILPVQTVLFPV